MNMIITLEIGLLVDVSPSSIVARKDKRKPVARTNDNAVVTDRFTGLVFIRTENALYKLQQIEPSEYINWLW